jgi:hypothetical protein
MLKEGELTGLQPEKAEKGVSETRMELKSRETSEKDLIAAERR